MNFITSKTAILLEILKKRHICPMFSTKYLLPSLLFISLYVNVLGQTYDPYTFSNKNLNFKFDLNLSTPGGEMAKRFGNFTSIGFGLFLKSKHNWVYGIDGAYLFGGKIKELTLLDNMVNGAGFISKNNGSPANYAVNMRGLTFFAKGGRLFSLSHSKPNQGILVLGGLGYLQHKINFQTTQNDLPALDPEYSKGYDRLTDGFALNQFVGYFYQSSNKMINFYCGFDFVQAFTKNRRGFNYDTRQFDSNPGTDFIHSFRFGWMFPMALGSKHEDEFIFR